MRVISMVPSWTETLLECGVSVVGRTRFCIHPHDKVASIPVVGGTKDIDWAKVKALNADLLVLDQDENPKKMAEDATLPWVATHVRSVADMPSALHKLYLALPTVEALSRLSQRWEWVRQQPPRLLQNWQDLPGVLEWLNRPSFSAESAHSVHYMIWKGPWMQASAQTFIGSVLSQLGCTLPQQDKPYPELELSHCDPRKTLLLLSSEPYPFAKRRADILALVEQGFAVALVDGEAFSWFGVRSLRFLEKSLGALE